MSYSFKIGDRVRSLTRGYLTDIYDGVEGEVIEIVLSSTERTIVSVAIDGQNKNVLFVSEHLELIQTTKDQYITYNKKCSTCGFPSRKTIDDTFCSNSKCKSRKSLYKTYSAIQIAKYNTVSCPKCNEQVAFSHGQLELPNAGKHIVPSLPPLFHLECTNGHMFAHEMKINDKIWHITFPYIWDGKRLVDEC